MRLSAETPASGILPPDRGRRVNSAGEWAIAVTLIHSSVLAVGGAYVFCASIWPVSIDTGYGSVLLDFPWILAYLVLAATWVAGPVILLVLGLVQLLRPPRHRWRWAGGWAAALVASAAAGFLVIHGYRLLFSAYPTDIAGEPLGPSHWAPASPYWPALVAAAGELATAAILTALARATFGKRPEDPRLSLS